VGDTLKAGPGSWAREQLFQRAAVELDYPDLDESNRWAKPIANESPSNTHLRAEYDRKHSAVLGRNVTKS
jgi:hypothetical protein